ncbi:MAG: YdcF family protein [Alphaproteobacteria bacterium]
MKKLFFKLVVIFTIYLCGLSYFIFLIYSEKNRKYSTSVQTDAIVVLTGGTGRIQKAIELLANGQAKKLLISGVGHNTNLKDIEYINEEFPINFVQNLKDRITLDYQANNTKGNAKETSTWLKNHNLKNIFLVTSDYHMPRSKLEFKLIMPEIKILPIAVSVDDSTLKSKLNLYNKIFIEYNKYLITKFNSKFDKKKL